MLVPLDWRLLSLGRGGREAWRIRSCSLSDEAVDEMAESGFDGWGASAAGGCESGSAMEGIGLVSEEGEWDIVAAAMLCGVRCVFPSNVVYEAGFWVGSKPAVTRPCRSKW